MRVLALEGPDGSGKSSLSNWLVREKGFISHHEGAPGPWPQGTADYYAGVMKNVVDQAKQGGALGVVFDRLVISEAVYAPALHRDILITVEQAGDFVVASPAIFVLCLPSPETCFKNWKNSRKAELFDDELVFWETYARYGHLATQGMFDLIFDYTATTYDALWERLKR